MTKVIITDDYYLNIHEKGHTLYKKQKKLDKNGNVWYRAFGYYIKVEHALNVAARLKVMSEHEEMTISEYLKEYKQAIEELTRVVQS